VFNAFQKLNVEEYRSFDDFQELSGVDACYIPGGEQRVTLYRAQGGSLVLRKGIYIHHLCIVWNPESKERSVPFMIPYDKVVWNEFFNIALGGKDLKPLPEISILSNIFRTRGCNQ
jgi:hypothetical protein